MISFSHSGYLYIICSNLGRTTCNSFTALRGVLHRMKICSENEVISSRHPHFTSQFYRMVGTHEGTGRARILYLSNGTRTDIILSVSMGTY